MAATSQICLLETSVTLLIMFNIVQALFKQMLKNV